MTKHEEVIFGHGHENVTGAHDSTFEVTSDDYLTPAGDCILGIEADHVPDAFDDAFVEACQHSDARIRITLETDEYSDTVHASGHPDLTFESSRSLVVRTSEYVDDRTVAVEADKAATDIDRDLVDALSEGASMTTTLTVEQERT